MPKLPLRLLKIFGGVTGVGIISAAATLIYIHLVWSFNSSCELQRQQVLTAPDQRYDAVAYTPECGALSPAAESRGLAIMKAGDKKDPEDSEIVVQPTAEYFQFVWRDAKTLEVSHHSLSIRLPESIDEVTIVEKRE